MYNTSFQPCIIREVASL